MKSFLRLNDYEINANTDEQVEIILSLASGKLNRNEFTEWLSKHIKKLT